VSLRCSAQGCPGWPIRPEDHFCGWCAAPLQGLECKLQHFQSGSWSELAQPLLSSVTTAEQVRLRVTHVGTVGAFACVVLDSPVWLQWSPQPTLVAPGETTFLNVARLDLPGPSVHSAEVTVGLGPARGHVLLHFAPPPVWGQPEPVSACIEDGGEWLVPIALEQGRVVVEPSVGTTTDGFEVSWEKRTPFHLSAGTAEAAVLRVRATTSMLAILERAFQDNEQPPSTELSIQVPYSWNGPGASQIKVRLVSCLPPQLRVEPFGPSRHYQWSVFPGPGQNLCLAIKLANGQATERHRARLAVLGFEGLPPWVRLEGVPFPLELSSGESASVALRVLDCPAGSETVVLRVQLQDHGVETFYLHLQPLRPQRFAGWLALDLGHSCLTAAYFDQHGTVDLLRWADTQDTRTGAQITYMRGFPAAEPIFGTRAAELALTASGEQASVSSAKHAMQRGAELLLYPVEQPAETLRIQPSQVLADQLQFVLHAAMQHRLGSGHEDCVPARVIVCHPARFSAREHQQVRAALTAALHRLPGGEQGAAEVFFGCEPVLACLDFLCSGESLRRLGFSASLTGAEKHVLVYDCGGQTVDLSLLKVSVSRVSSHVLVKPELLGLDGFPDLGGGWVTQQLAELMLRGLATPVAVSRLSPLHQRQLAALADSLKLALHGEGSPKSVAAAWSEWALKVGLRKPHEPLRIPGQAHLDEWCRPGLQRTLELARKLLLRHGLPAPDAVLRVGRGAKLNLIDTLLRQYFPDAVQLQPEQWKECVVLGCAHHPAVQQLRGLRLQPASAGELQVRLYLDSNGPAVWTTSRWGVKAESDEGPLFWEVLPAGLALADDGARAPLVHCSLQPGINWIHVLENLGHTDELQDNDQILEAGTVRIDLPAAMFAGDQEAPQVLLCLSPQLQASVELWRKQEKLGVFPVESSPQPSEV
jgi:hypothetical protein